MALPTVINPAGPNANTADAGSINAINSSFGGSIGGTPLASVQPSFSGAGTAAPAAKVDPYAAYGGTAAYNALRSGFQTQRNQIGQGVTDSIGQAGSTIGSSILDLIASLKTGQRAIDTKATQAELAKKQGMQGVLDHISQGIQSGGVVLANRNASDSSATGALADAYGKIGRQQASEVGGQYAQDEFNINQDQLNLDDQRALGSRHISENKNQVINSIVSDAQNKLASLDAAIAGASLPDRINIEAEKQNVRNQATSALQQYDTQLSQGLAGVGASTQEQRISAANDLATQGIAPETSYNYTTEAPAQFQGTGPFASSLPLFQMKRRGA